MKISINDKEYNLKFTFNSVRYMEDVKFPKNDDEIFKSISFLTKLFYGAMNWCPSKEYSRELCDTLLMTYLENNDLTKFMEELTAELEQSGFFKIMSKED